MSILILAARWLVFAAFHTAAVAVRGDGAFSIFSAPSGDVFIVTDVMPAGKGFKAPTKENPIRCLAIDFGCSFGSNVGDKVPDPKMMREMIVKILAEQGYRGHDAQHPPQLLVTLQWGYLCGDLGANFAFLCGDKLDHMWEYQNMPWIDPRVLVRGMRDPRATKIMNVSKDDLYVMTVCGFDYATYRAGKAEMLWKTYIACSSIGLTRQKVLPDMITLAGPAIGRETRSVIIANPADKREGRVEFGDLEVIEEEAAAPSSETKP